MKHSIMVVDDSRVVFAEMSKFLAGSDIEIIHYCRSGEAAIADYQTFMPDLVTLDIVMPGMDGLETCRQLRQRWPEANVLIVSSLAYDDTITAAREMGAQGFLFKPFNRESLLNSLYDALGVRPEDRGGSPV